MNEKDIKRLALTYVRACGTEGTQTTNLYDEVEMFFSEDNVTIDDVAEIVMEIQSIDLSLIAQFGDKPCSACEHFNPEKLCPHFLDCGQDELREYWTPKKG